MKLLKGKIRERIQPSPRGLNCSRTYVPLVTSECARDSQSDLSDIDEFDLTLSSEDLDFLCESREESPALWPDPLLRFEPRVKVSKN